MAAESSGTFELERVLPSRQDLRVTEHKVDLVTLLRELDDPEWLERPRGYDRGELGVLTEPEPGLFHPAPSVAADNPLRNRQGPRAGSPQSHAREGTSWSPTQTL